MNRRNEKPFPKPPPADPLPLETWLRRTDRSEAGREPFFRGREAEYEVYRSAVTSLSEGIVGGGTMVFQGAPGAGKSALMEECMEAVRRHSTPEAPWVAVAIRPETLKSAVDVMILLIEAANAENERLSKIAPGTAAGKLKGFLEIGRKLYGELSERGIGVASVSVGGKPEAGGSGDTANLSEPVFRSTAPLLENLHLVVLVDEAQNIPVSGPTKGVMDCLHHPPAKIPLVSAFFGLSDTQRVLRDCGLSRFADERVVTLEPLPDEDSACAIRSAFDAYGFVGTQEDWEVWVNRLAELSQGWPQHINRVAVAAARVIFDNGGCINGALLEEALESGRKRKDAYYAGRLAAGTQDPGLYKQIALAAETRPNGILPRATLRDLTSFELDNSQDSFDDFLTNALHVGLLSQTKDLPYHYHIPIPSFGDYLRALPVESPQ